MARTLYTTEIRMLLCPNCGAPLEAPLAGGRLRCSHCGQSSELAGRRQETVSRSTLSEAERFDKLRAQDGKPMMPPPNLRHFMQGGGLAPQLAADALADWQRARAEVAAGASFGSQERLYFLTLLLYGHYSKTDEARTRAMLETVLDLLPASRHRQVTRGMLARLAAKGGDLTAAEAWLAPMNPASDDIYEDSAYRLTMAYVATAKGDYQRVLAVLGHREGDVPIADGQDEVCALLRANAHERLGRIDDALALVRQVVGVAGEHLALCDRIIEASQSLRLCQHSYPTVRAEVAPRAAARRKRGGGGRLLFRLPFVAAPFVFLVLALTADPAATTDDGMPMRSFWLLFAAGWGVAPIIFGVIAVFGVRARRLREHGLPGVATIVSVQGTGTRVNGQPLIKLHLSVRVGDRPAYEANKSQVVPGAQLAQFQPGVSLRVKVDPKKPTRLVFDQGG